MVSYILYCIVLYPVSFLTLSYRIECFAVVVSFTLGNSKLVFFSMVSHTVTYPTCRATIEAANLPGQQLKVYGLRFSGFHSQLIVKEGLSPNPQIPQSRGKFSITPLLEYSKPAKKTNIITYFMQTQVSQHQFGACKLYRKIFSHHLIFIMF